MIDHSTLAFPSDQQLGESSSKSSAAAPSLLPARCQVYNVFYSVHPHAARLEPLLLPELERSPPIQVLRYSRAACSLDQQADEVADYETIGILILGFTSDDFVSYRITVSTNYKYFSHVCSQLIRLSGIELC